jgi:hypothetical protein
MINDPPGGSMMLPLLESLMSVEFGGTIRLNTLIPPVGDPLTRLSN